MEALTNGLARLKQSFSGSSFSKHVMVVSGSVAIGQAISILVGPINSRLYKPSDYGTLSLFGAMFGLLGIVGTMQYEMALGTTDDDTEAVHILLLCLLLVGLWTGLITIVTIAAGEQLTHLISKDDTQFYRYLWFLPVGVCANALFSTFSRWAMRKHAFPELSFSQIIQGIIASTCTVGLGLLHVGFPGLITGAIMASAFGLWRLPQLAFPELRAQKSLVSLKGLWETARRHYRYPLYTTWSVLLNSLSGMIPVFLLTGGFGNTYTGYFSLCQRILFMPTLLISGAITPVFYSRAKQAQKDGTLASLTSKLINSISGVNVFFAVFLALFGELLFVLVFGGQWRRSGQYAAALAPWMMFSFLVYPLEALPLIFERQRASFVFQIVLVLLRTGALMIGIALKSDLLAMWLFGGVSAIYMLVYFIWMLRLVDGPVLAVLMKLGKDFALALAAFGACRIVMWWSNDNLWITGLCLVPVLGYFGFRGLRQILQARNQT